MPSDIGQFSALASLTVDGACPLAWGGVVLPRLTSIESQCRGAVWPWLLGAAETHRLERLLVAHARDDSSIPSALWSLSSLTSVQLSKTGFAGTLPTLLSNMTQLGDFFLWGAQLSGTLPDLSRLTRLTFLTLASTRVGGPLPRLPVNLRHL